MSKPEQRHFGSVLRLYRQLNGFRPAGQLCASYVLIHSLNGDQCYVPGGPSVGCEVRADRFVRTTLQPSFDEKRSPTLLNAVLQQWTRKEDLEMANKVKRKLPSVRRTHKTSADFLRWLRERNDVAKRKASPDSEKTGS